ncbi:hypothetical protein PG999_001389 [Apiospora kogelbergensis]|uniref:SWR1-complex protein 3 domain-containing protein n=1 Tax=Apiospora kogelbergensis TaxID=1337665 RepID=A0AAW0REM7_9PEZI
MERKRKLPPRAAARVEHVAKKRTATPPEKSATSTPAPPTPVPEPVVEEPPLPKSLQPGHPLPTVEKAQADDLSNKAYQSVQESGVLAESLIRSRQKWIHEGIFEKYWTKPVKRKGVVKEEPNNPAKDSMTKIGTVTITVEPHAIEATMFAIKDPKPPAAPTTNSTFRPIMQYGPPNGVMPPPPKPATPATPSTPAAVPASPSQGLAKPSTQAAAVNGQALAQPPQPPPVPTAQPNAQVRPPTPSQAPLPNTNGQRPAPPVSGVAMNPYLAGAPPPASPRGLESVLAAPGAAPPPAAPSTAMGQPPLRSPSVAAPNLNQPLRSPAHASGQPGLSHPRPLHSPIAAPGAAPAGPPGARPPTGAPAAKPPTPGAKPATPAPGGADPIIVTLAEKASEDPHLRDLMKRVAVGDAAAHELAHFQKIIDQITADYKKRGGQQGPSADRLIVDGRTVQYFADEVNTILDIVLSSNPNQKGADLIPPLGSDPLVILLVRKALDDAPIKSMVKRVAEKKTKFNDTTDLKAVLDKLKDLVPKDAPKPQPALPAQSPSSANPARPQTAESAPNSAPGRKSSVASMPQTPTSNSQQALRSKGPPPNLKPDISGIVFEFAGGTGDRYLFPKFSILEYQAGGSQLLASFLLVRKGSKSEYGGDPALDYYQPITIRLQANSGKHLENLARVVAPQDEVKRYMDDIMSSMTRAEYILLAMRLPRHEKEDQADDRAETPKPDQQVRQVQQPHQQAQTEVLWATKGAKMPPHQAVGKVMGEEEQYQSFIASVS